MKKNIQISIVICHYYLSDKKLTSILNFLLADNLFNIARVVVVQNGRKINLKIKKNENKLILIEGSNGLLDFSAFLEGADQLDDEEIESGILFFNDTLFTKWPSWWILKKISNDLSSAASLDVPCLVGFGASYPFFLQENPWSKSNSYMCSAAFYANVHAVKVLTKITKNCIENVNLVVANSLDEKIIKEYVGEKFYSYLKILLLKSSGGVWRPSGKERFSSEMRIKKAFCFYLEHYFSASVQMRQGGLIFINRGKYKFVFQLRTKISLFF